jgi:hypothetical protein
MPPLQTLAPPIRQQRHLAIARALVKTAGITKPVRSNLISAGVRTRELIHDRGVRRVDTLVRFLLAGGIVIGIATVVGTGWAAEPDPGTAQFTAEISEKLAKLNIKAGTGETPAEKAARASGN